MSSYMIPKRMTLHLIPMSDERHRAFYLTAGTRMVDEPHHGSSTFRHEAPLTIMTDQSSLPLLAGLISYEEGGQYATPFHLLL